MARVTIRAIDHLVLTVASIERTIAFYEQALGMVARAFTSDGQRRYALHFGVQKFNLHEVGQVLDSNVRHATPGSADLCLLSDTPIDAVLEHLRTCEIPIILGPVNRTGSQRQLHSIYFYDPDDNLIEVSNEIVPL